MKLQVKAFGPLPQVLAGYEGRDSMDLEIPDNATVADMIAHLQLPPHMRFVVVVDGNIKKSEDSLQSGDVVSIFIPVAGG